MKSPNYLERSLAIAAAVTLALGASACTGGEATSAPHELPKPTVTSEQADPNAPFVEVHDVIKEYLYSHDQTDDSDLNFKGGKLHMRWVLHPQLDNSPVYDYSLSCKAGALVVSANDLKYSYADGWVKDTHTASLKQDPACRDGILSPADNLLARSDQIKVRNLIYALSENG